MWRIACASLTVCVLILAGCGRSLGVDRTGDLPSYECRFVAAPPVVDGRLDDPAWNRASTVELSLSDGNGPPRRPTTVRAVWTETHLYLSFHCLDEDIWAGHTEHDAKLYEEEVVEVFLNENGDRKAYVELEVSPNNTSFDVLIINPGGGRKFKSMLDYACDGWKTAVTVDGTLGQARSDQAGDDKSWTVEMAIPFDQLILAPNHPPKPGDRWCWNIFRIDRGGKHGEFTAWSPPLKPSFHTPERFGSLYFAK